MKMYTSYLFTFILLTSLACNEDDNSIEDHSISDSTLIQLIEKDKNLKTYNDLILPSRLVSSLERAYPSHFIISVLNSEDFGFKISMIASNPLSTDVLSSTYADVKGRLLKNDGREESDLGEDDNEESLKECFSFIYPISFTLPDGSTVEGEDSHAVSQKLRAWYSENGAIDERPQLNFPLMIIHEDERKTIESQDHMSKLIESCEAGQVEDGTGDDTDEGDDGTNDEMGEDLPSDDSDEDAPEGVVDHLAFIHFDCFEITFPIRISLPDDSEIIAENKESLLTSIEAWKANNPDAVDSPDLLYPFEILYEGQSRTVLSQAELRDLETSCDRDGSQTDEDIDDPTDEDSNSDNSSNNFDCPDAKANVGEKCLDLNLREGILDRNCQCIL